MDADAFEAFKENGIYDKETAASFREHILSKGGTVEAEKMYLNFRGKEPKIEPLLEKRGLNKVKM
jgi:peptidyl-dipeptidase Dcp